MDSATISNIGDGNDLLYSRSAGFEPVILKLLLLSCYTLLNSRVNSTILEYVTCILLAGLSLISSGPGPVKTAPRAIGIAPEALNHQIYWGNSGESDWIDSFTGA
jgi:hypothetical protein